MLLFLYLQNEVFEKYMEKVFEILFNVFVFKYKVFVIPQEYLYLNINFNVFDPMSGWDKHRIVVDLDRFTVCT